jgi:hypothetical protein
MTYTSVLGSKECLNQSLLIGTIDLAEDLVREESSLWGDTHPANDRSVF